MLGCEGINETCNGQWNVDEGDKGKVAEKKNSWLCFGRLLTFFSTIVPNTRLLPGDKKEKYILD